MTDLFGEAPARTFEVELKPEHYSRAHRGSIRQHPTVLALEEVIGHYPEMSCLGDIVFRPAAAWWAALPPEVFAATKAWQRGERAKALTFELVVPARAVFPPSLDVLWGPNWRTGGRSR